MLLVPPLHMYRQLRGAYLIGRFSALLRTLLLISMSGYRAQPLHAAAARDGRVPLGVAHAHRIRA